MLQQDSPAVQAVACEGLAKLMLSGMLYDATVSLSGSARLTPIEPFLPTAASKLDPAISFPGDHGQFTLTSMSKLLLPGVLLFFSSESTEDAQRRQHLL
jgi:hypothetical protein